MLSVTEACNLDCAVCYEKSKTPKTMDLETAKASLTYEFENSEGFDEIEIDLFGGEPTLRQDFIKEIVEWTIQSKFKKPFIFFIQTNGTLIHGEFQDWLVRHKSFVNVGLSLDGTPETHNSNRSDSYDKIDIGFFVRNYPHQGVRMTICPKTASNLFNDVVHLHGLGFQKVDAFFAYGVKWNSEGMDDVLATQLRLLCDYYLLHPEVKECSVFDMSISNLTNSSTVTQKWCGTGVEMVSVSAEGKKYPCHAFQPNTTNDPVELGKIAFDEIKDFSDQGCSSCGLEQLCPSCYGINHLETGNMTTRTKQFCNVTKVRANAVAYLRANQIAAGTSKMEPGQQLSTIDAIHRLQGIM